MNNEEIRQLWKACGGSFHGPHIETATMPEAEMFSFIRSVIASEREACAKVCDGLHTDNIIGGCDEYVAGRQMGAMVCANKIRMRSNATGEQPAANEPNKG